MWTRTGNTRPYVLGLPKAVKLLEQHFSDAGKDLNQMGQIIVMPEAKHQRGLLRLLNS